MTGGACLLVAFLSCKRADPPSPKGETAYQLAAGAHHFVLRAESGKRKGSSVEGALTLRATSASDRSPKTGQLAFDRSLPSTPLYGWIDVPLQGVDAPLCDSLASSAQDPVFPGVLVMLPNQRMDFLPPRPDSAPLLFVGTLRNRRVDEHVMDGCGFVMVVQGSDEHNKECLGGVWKLWGRQPGGEGSFTLCPE